MYDLVNFIGRLRPVTNAHIDIIRMGMKQSRYIHINVGSCFQPRTERSPFRYDEVVAMVRGAFEPEEQERLLFSPILDTPYSNTQWQNNIRHATNMALKTIGGNSDEDLRVGIIGHRKDQNTSEYLSMFPDWDFVPVGNLHDNLSATTLRDHLFKTHAWDDTFRDSVPSSTMAFLKDFVRTRDCAELFSEVDYYRNYRQGHADAEALIEKQLGFKTQIKHQTVDALVVKSGHVLLIQRKNLPGRGLWAIPGGFLDDEEWLESAALRELKEETHIDVPPAVLRGGIQDHMRADYPYRSARGRVISDVFLIKLADGPFPKVRGRSDAKVAKWVPITDLTSENMFEDHYAICQYLLNRMRDE